MKQLFAVACIIGFLWGTYAFASELGYVVDFGKAKGANVVNTPGQYQTNGVIVEFNGEKIIYDVTWQWNSERCVLVPIVIEEVTDPVIPKECDNVFYRILHKKECEGWVDPNDTDLKWTCPYSLGHHSYCAVCEKDDANRDGTDGCDDGEGQCNGSWHCAEGLICDPKTHKCRKP